MPEHHDAPGIARELDKFYTRPEMVEECLRDLRRAAIDLGLDDPALTVEPSAGAGAFLDRISGPKTGIDLAPEAPGIERSDFLKWTPPVTDGPIWTVGNPPFGKNSSLAVRFFNHAARFSSLIAFVLPRTFQKNGLQNRLDLSFGLVHERVLPARSFTMMGDERDVPAVFQVWTRGEPRTRVHRPTACDDFRFAPLGEAAIAVQRVGAAAGRVRMPPFGVSPQSHHGIIPVTVSVGEMARRLRTLDYDSVKHNTAGNPSVGRADLVSLYADRFGGGVSRG